MTNSATSSDTNGNIALLGSERIGKLLWDYSIPAVVGMVVMSLFNVIDRIFIGQGVGPEAIAGLAITFPVMNISAAIGVLVGAGASAKISIFMGAKDFASAEKTLGNTLTLILINATIYLTLMWIFIDDILLAFGASEKTLPYARDFMLYILPGMLVMNTGFSLNNTIRASGYPIKAMVSMFIGAGLNVILAPIFIFYLNWGIKGAAIATDISMSVVTIYVLCHLFNKNNSLHFKPNTYKLNRNIVIGIIGIGAAPSLVNLASCFINILINKSLYHYGGDNAVAAAGIFTTYASLMCMTVVGICQGMQPIVGYNYGAGNFHRLKKAYLLTVISSSVIVVIGGIFGLQFPQYIARAFTTDTDLINVIDNAFRIALLCFGLVGFQIVSTTFFQSIGKVGQSIFLSLSRQVIFIIPLLIIMPQYLGLNGIWAAFPISDVLATVVSAILIFYQFKKSIIKIC